MSVENRCVRSDTSKRKNNDNSDDDSATSDTSVFVEPTENDIRCGRGMVSRGTRIYRRLVALNKDFYWNCWSKAEKGKISRSIVEAFVSEGRRFIEYDSKTAKWKIVPLKKAIAKTSQALRDGRPKGSLEGKGDKEYSLWDSITALLMEQRKRNEQREQQERQANSQIGSLGKRSTHARADVGADTATAESQAPNKKPKHGHPSHPMPPLSLDSNGENSDYGDISTLSDWSLFDDEDTFAQFEHGNDDEDYRGEGSEDIAAKDDWFLTACLVEIAQEEKHGENEISSHPAAEQDLSVSRTPQTNTCALRPPFNAQQLFLKQQQQRQRQSDRDDRMQVAGTLILATSPMHPIGKPFYHNNNTIPLESSRGFSLPRHHKQQQ